MQIVTNGRNIELTEPIKSHVQDKVGQLQQHFAFIQEIHVILEVEKNPRITDNQLAEATVHVPGAVVRVEAASPNLYTSIDRLVEKIDRSLRKHKTKLLSRTQNNHDTIRRDEVEVLEPADLLEDEVEVELEVP